MKTLKDLNRLELTCESLHLKKYNVGLEYGKLYVIYNEIRFNKLSELRTYVSSNRNTKFLRTD